MTMQGAGLEREMRVYLDKAEILEAIHRYCRAIDRGAIDLLRSLYHPDATEAHGIYDGTASGYCDYVAAFVGGAGVSAHNITTSVIEVDGDRAWSEAYFIAVHREVPDPVGGMIDLMLGGRYLDRLERRDEGAWKIAHRQVVYDWNDVGNLVGRWTGPFFEQWRPLGATDLTDPSHAHWRGRAPKT